MQIDTTVWNAHDRRVIAKMIMRLFASWTLTSDEMGSVLGLSPSNNRTLDKLRQGSPIALSRHSIERAGHFLGIHKNLRLLFPRNRDLAYAWMKTSNLAFNGRTPIEMIGEHGLTGLLMVRAYLDQAVGGQNESEVV